MSYNFGLIAYDAFKRRLQWIKGQSGPYQGGKPPFDVAEDNNYQNYADNFAGTGAIATFKSCNASNQFEITSGHTIVDGALTLASVAVPATPTLTINGAQTGSTGYSYAVVGRSGNLQAPSAAVATTKGMATITATNSITITFVPTPGFLVYDIYRTASAGTPASTGRIGFVAAGINTPNVSSTTLSFTDTGIVADGSTIPSANTTGAIVGDFAVYGNLTVSALSTPATPLVTHLGATGAATWTYKIVARSGTSSHTAASAGGSDTSGAATLTAANAEFISWQPVPGATIYDVYRTAHGTGPTTLGLIGSTTGTTFTDTGLAGDASTAPTTNTTGSSSTSAGAQNYVGTESGSANAIAATIAGATLAAGLQVTVQLAHTLQAGSGGNNTFALNGGAAVNIMSHFNPATKPVLGYAATGVITMLYNGSVWLDMSQ